MLKIYISLTIFVYIYLCKTFQCASVLVFRITCGFVFQCLIPLIVVKKKIGKCRFIYLKKKLLPIILSYLILKSEVSFNVRCYNLLFSNKDNL